VSGGRLGHAVAAFLRQEFGASVAAIIGFVDILIEDAHRPDLADCLADLQRMREAGKQLSALIAQAVDASQGSEGEMARLRHELRTPLNAIKGYGELLVEEARDGGRDTLLSDLGHVLDLADRLLDDLVGPLGAQSLGVSQPQQVVAGRSAGLQRARVEQGADLAERVAQAGVGTAADGRGAFVGRVQAEDDPHGSGLARTVRADEPGDLPGYDGERHAVQSEGRPEPLTQPGDFDGCLHGQKPRDRGARRSSRDGAVFGLTAWWDGGVGRVPRAGTAGLPPGAMRPH